MENRNRVHPACINAGNRYHRCTSFCYQRISAASAPKSLPNVEDFPPLQGNTIRKDKPHMPNASSAPLRVAKTGREAWSSLFQIGRTVEKENKCTYVSPREVSSGKTVPWIPKEAISANVAKWNRTLAGYVVGDKPFYSHLRACVHRLWRPKGNLQVHSRENGYFFFVFELEEDCSRILQGGPWMFDKRVIVLRRWTPELTMDRDLLSSIPVWVRFPDLPLKFWSTKCISIIASSIGKPMFVDKATASGERYSYARCFVEIEAKTKLPNVIEVAVEDEANAIISVEYENLPPKCTTCECFGHSSSQCTFKKVWVEKGKSVPEVVGTVSSEDVPTSAMNQTTVEANAKEFPESSAAPGIDATVGSTSVDDPDNDGNDDDANEEYENEWMEEFDGDATMENLEWEEEMNRLSTSSKAHKKQQNAPSRKSSRTPRKNRRYD